MTNTITDRKRKADETLQPISYFSYVLQFDQDGSFYVGSTNAPLARFSEHAAGIGAKVTAEKGPFKIRLILPFLSRKEAEYNESRIQAALEKGPKHVEALLEVFDRMLNIVRPQKTFSELRQEEEEYVREMKKVFHYSENTFATLMVSKPKPTACGWLGEHYGTNDWPELKKMGRDEDFTGNIYGRKVCRRCLEHAPED